MNEQDTERDKPEDTEGHRIRRFDADAESAEGDQDDVEGHRPPHGLP